MSAIEGDRIGPFWQDTSGDWHLDDEVPYSRVSQRAEQVFNAINGMSQSETKYPAIIAETPEAYSSISSLLGDNSYDKLVETVEVLETALEKEYGKSH